MVKTSKFSYVLFWAQYSPEKNWSSQDDQFDIFWANFWQLKIPDLQMYNLPFSISVQVGFQNNYISNELSQETRLSYLTQRNCWRWWYNNQNVTQLTVECPPTRPSIWEAWLGPMWSQASAMQGSQVWHQPSDTTRTQMRTKVSQKFFVITSRRLWAERTGRRRGSWQQRRRTSRKTSLKQSKVSHFHHTIICWMSNKGLTVTIS